MSETTQRHDKFFKKLFTWPDTARDFLAYHLPPELSSTFVLETLEQNESSFLDEELQAFYSDLLFRVRLRDGREAWVYLLLEHKSWAAEDVGWQILYYMVRIWERLRRKHGWKEKLPPIFPFVIYQGKEKWKAPLNFRDYVDFAGHEELKRYVPEFEYFLFSVQDYDEHTAPGNAYLRVGLAALKYIWENDLVERMPEIIKMLQGTPFQEALGFVEPLLRYFASAGVDVVKDEDLHTAVHKGFPREGEKIMPSVVDRWIEQGRNEGVQQGLQQATALAREEVRQALANNAVRQLRRRFGAKAEEWYAPIGELETKQLEKLSEALLAFRKVADIGVWLSKHAGLPLEH